MPIRLCRTLVAILVAGALAAPAGATTPDPRHCTVDAVVVGNASGTAIGGAPPGFDVVARDFLDVPRAGATVWLEFSASTLRLDAVQAAGTTLDCAGRRLSRVTDASGAVKFAPCLGGFDPADAIEVVVDGVVIARVRGRSTDLDGVDGRTGLGDLVIFADRYLDHPQATETDFDLGGQTGLGDFVIFAQEYLGGATNAYCP